jgi:hypothetical protein
MNDLLELFFVHHDHGRASEPSHSSTALFFVDESSTRRVVPALRHAAQRERQIVRARHLGRRGGDASVHRFSSARFRHGALADIKRFALGGALVIPDRRQLHATDLGAVLSDAQMSHIDRMTFGSGQSLVVFGRAGASSVVLRVGRCASPGAPAHAFEALRLLDGDRRVPRPISSGQLRNTWSWAVETAVSGISPSPKDSLLFTDQAAEFLSRLPHGEASPSLQTDLTIISEGLGDRFVELTEFGEHLEQAIAGMPSVMRHGDFWPGNVLFDGQRLVGVVDWDWWSNRGVPGADLLHYIATANRLRRRVSIGDVLASEPWTLSHVRPQLARLLAASGLDDDAQVVQVVVAAWWVTQIAGDLYRDPGLALNSRWIDRNISRSIPSLLSHVRLL